VNKNLHQLLFRSIFILTHHFLCFRLVFLSVIADLVGKFCGGKLGWSILSISYKKSTLSYLNTITNNLLWSGLGFRCLKYNNQYLKVEGRMSKGQLQQPEADWGGKEMMKSAGKSRQHWQTRGDNGGNKALPQTSNVGSVKRQDNDG
jgi:hypothetical protein